jgi:hypothetical protein
MDDPPGWSFLSDDAPVRKTVAPIAEEVEPPIHASGVYNIGDDVDFDDGGAPPPERRARPVKRLLRTTKAAAVRPRARPPPEPELVVAPLPKQPRAKVATLIEKLKNSDWDGQSEALAVLTNEAEMITAEIQLNLSGLLESVLECAGSPRSALAKNALGCLLKWIGIREINFDPGADRCAADLLGLLSARYDKHFITNLAGQCLTALFAAIPASHAIAICLNEHRRKHDLPRMHVANAIHGLVPRIGECQSILRPLAVLIRDKNPDVRKAAKAALAACHVKFPNIAALIETCVPTEDDRSTLRSNL